MSERRSLLQESLAAIERLQARLEASERAGQQPIAIIGAGCRYPGGVESPAELWRVVRDGVNAVSEVPADRWDANAFYDPDPKAPGKMVTKRGGFLSQVDRFDPQFFGISPREAATLDPQQRLLLETSCEALESAGLATDKLAGSATGVFVGITTSDYGQLMRLGGPEHSDVYSATGSALNAAAGRVSFTFGFQGPCVSVDTACSSSLVAVHLACQSLRTGESDLALAGGVNVILSPDAMVLFSKWGMMAPDGACKTFDAAADGFVRAEGCAVIALKRLSDAVAAGDPILAVIRGSAVNSDGRSSGLTVPNGPAQEAVLRKALASANLTPADIDYVEAHGTGTSLGDPIEAEALGAVMRQGRSAQGKLLIGSVKTNLGHTEAASGLAGLLKVVMSLRHEAIPASLHFSRPNERIPWADLPLAVPTQLTPWQRGERVRRAGVSSFGFSGTNAHVILEEAPLADTDVAAAAKLPAPERQSPGAVLVPISARDEVALRKVAARYAEFLATHPQASLADVSFTAATGRAHLLKRAALIVDSPAALQSDLRQFADGQKLPSLLEGASRAGERPKIAFLFTGQGSQYAGMARGLYDTEAVFRDSLDRAAALLAPHLQTPLLDVLFAQGATSALLAQTLYTQPALFAVEFALAELWKSWGITPAVVMGHSVGEYVAACVAGVFSFEDGIALIAARAQMMQALPAGGGMAALFADEARVAPHLAAHAGRLSLAALNGPEETVVSGDAAALSDMLSAAAAAGIKSRTLEVSHAFHSPLLEPMLDAFERRAAGVAMQMPRLQLISNLTGQAFAAGVGPDARYWRRHAREPVRFAACIEALGAAGVTALVEVGPHPTLLALAARAAPAATWLATSSLRRGRDDRREMLSALGALYVRGASVHWNAVNVPSGSRRIALPTYPFQRERHWVSAPSAQKSNHADRDPDVHPLLGRRQELAGSPADFIWENLLSLDSHPWLTDHRVQGAAIVPATAYIEMALAAAREVLGDGSVSIKQIENLKPIVLHEGMSRTLQATVHLAADGTASFAVYSRIKTGAAGAGRRPPWTQHVSATVARSDAPKADSSLLEEARARCARSLSGADFYRALAHKGNQWGPCFQGVEQLWIGDGEAVGRIQVAGSLLDEVGHYRFHPAVSDACGHPLVATAPLEAGDGTNAGAFVGGGVGEIRFHQAPSGTTLWVHAKRRVAADSDARVVIGDVHVYDEGGALISETLDARLWYLDESSGGEILGVPDDWYYEVQWHAKALDGTRARAADNGSWLVFADRAGVGAQIAARRDAAGGACITVMPGEAFSLNGSQATIRPGESEDYHRLVAAIDKLSAVVHLWSTDSLIDLVGSSADTMVAPSLLAGDESVLHLIGALRGAGSRPRVWLVTAGTQKVVAGDRCAAPLSAALWGIGRTLSVEHSEWWGGLIDLEPAELATMADRIDQEVAQADREDKIAWRGGQRYVARLARLHMDRTGAGQFAVHAEATYVVTGGLGGIGLAMSGWLASRGARHLLLLGRTPLPERGTWKQLGTDSASGRRVAAVQALEVMGVAVEVAAVDIAVPGALEACLAARRLRGEPPVRGVIHAAGTLQFESLATQDIASLRAGLNAKLFGAWRLHHVFENVALDCFILCSSSSALLSSPLLGGYAAGNACLDSLAHHRRARSQAALSVNWGTWGEVGMAVEAGRSAGGDMLNGLGTISTARGLAALHELLDATATQAAVMPVDWPALARAYPAFAADPFLSVLVGDVGATAAGSASGALTLTTLRAAPASEQGGLLAAYLRAEAASTLGMNVEALDPAEALSSFGFDSLMAVQLKNRIETDLRVVVPMIQFLQGPSVLQLSATLLSFIEALPSAAQGADAGVVEDWEEGSI